MLTVNGLPFVEYVETLRRVPSQTPGKRSPAMRTTCREAVVAVLRLYRVPLSSAAIADSVPFSQRRVATVLHELAKEGRALEMPRPPKTGGEYLAAPGSSYLIVSKKIRDGA